ncbi:Nicotinamide N-methyltransferase [Spironucleus salmonicida]|uniref:Nicotinamide N-methyltransferase n=1 Tax=Spironucleus salmonicida TaxID=348837 RepID=V6LEI3_9EUKA|nr:Nicotinamide N-methyltransferase [Spironucleus salmonicida]|eukprot:EST42925.1 hypothetical protein SS50377_17457 [Spironucleus salmonicida]
MFEPSSSPEQLTYVDIFDTRLQLLANDSLWSHILFNSAIQLAEFIQSNTLLFRDKTILELGSGSGLPAIIASRFSSQVVTTDFPNKQILNNINYNIINNNSTAKIFPLLWGNHLDQKFEVILVSDCIQMVQEHANILQTLKESLSPNGTIYVIFQHHQPEKKASIMTFFETARSAFDCVFVREIECQRQFPEDDAIYEKDVRQNCWLWELTWKK